MNSAKEAFRTLIHAIVFLAIFQQLLYNLGAAEPAVSTIITHQGTVVKLSTIQKVLRAATAENCNRLLYHLDGLDLHVPDGRVVHLSQLTTDTVTRHVDGVTMVVGGVEQDTGTGSLYIRKGSGYTVILDEDNFVHGVWAHSLALTPVHVDLHPGLYINVARDAVEKLTLSSMQGEPIVFENDEIIAPPIPYFPNRSESTPLPNRLQCSSLQVCRTVRIAAAADRGLCDRFSSSRSPFKRSLRHIQARVLLANEPFELQTCLRLSVVYLEMQCDSTKTDLFGSFTMLNGTIVLYEFQKAWNKNSRLSAVVRDMAMFFPSYYDFTITAGVAFGDAMCYRNWAFGWVEGFEPVAIAHETGHLLGARHTTSGLMVGHINYVTELRFASDSLASIFDLTDNYSEILPDCLPICSTGTTPTPTPTPTPPSTSAADTTCAAGYDLVDAIDCAKVSYGSHTVSGTRLILKVVQKPGSFKLKFRAKPLGTVIKSLSYQVSMTNSFRDRLLRKASIQDGGQADKTIGINPFALQLPADSSTCCGQTIYVRVSATLCTSTDVCASGKWTYSGNMICRRCSADKRVCACP